MAWLDDFMPLAGWALRHQDLRHRYLYATNASDVMSAPGVAWILEPNVTLAIYEAALGKGYREGETLGYERPYPHSGKRRRRTNPKRADLAFKDSGKGKNWGFIEVKCYGLNGKAWLQNDIAKLKSIKKRSQRWIFVYRVRPTVGKGQSLESLLAKNFTNVLKVHSSDSFITTDGGNWEDGICECCLAKVL